MIVAAALWAPAPAANAVSADPLTIYELQSNTFDGDVSVYDGELIDFAGGIVIGKFPGYRPRIMLQDPSHPDAWGGIQAKDWTGGPGLYDNIRVGDWVTITDIEVEEHRGGTFLQWYPINSPTCTIVSRNNPLPPPILCPVTRIPAPLQYPGDEWYVENHDPEPLEAMRLTVRNVTITEWNLGKENDNYNLQTPDGDDCWAADYMNADKDSWEDYHPFIEKGRHFCAVTGLFEQYTNPDTGYDYYQLITLSSADLAICGDGNNDGEVDSGSDLARFAECLTGPLCDPAGEGCDPPAWARPDFGHPTQHCLMMDLDYDGDVDLLDYVNLLRILETE